MKMLLGSLLLFCWSVLGNAANTITVELNGKQTEFEITLPANPTTGYRWTVTHYDNSFLQLVESRYIATQTKLLGVGGKTHFTFKLIAGKPHSAKTAISFKYARPWDPKSGYVRTITVNFQNPKGS